MSHDVFISYSSHDKPTADAACATREARGIRCWVAPRDILPGMDWSEAIIDAIVGCRLMIVIVSGHSNLSEQVFPSLLAGMVLARLDGPFGSHASGLSPAREHVVQPGAHVAFLAVALPANTP